VMSASSRQFAPRRKLDCFVACALRNDVESSSIQFSNIPEKYASAFPRRDSPGLCCIVSPEERAQGTPGACCTRGLVCKMHLKMRTRAYRYRRSIPTFPAQWLYGLCRALPGDEFVLPPSLSA
jgi:hypothetical protein